MKKQFLVLIVCLVSLGAVYAQKDSTKFKIKRVPGDTSQLQMNMDAVYNRPFLQFGKVPVAIGGYAEVNGQWAQSKGISEGVSFQMRRFTIFLSSNIYKKIKFLSEIEFEDGAKEINIEFAAIDFELHPLINIRGGIIMNPIGAFNQNHDGPKWDFIDRPLSATQLLPATFSNVGFGVHGKYYRANWVLAYELYITNGFNGRIIDNDQNKTFLPAAKLEIDRFEESFNGSPLLTGKVAVRHRKIGELGISYMGGVFNKFEEDGLRLDRMRRVDVIAADFNTTLPVLGTRINAEAAYIRVEVPATYTQQYGREQWGGYIDIVQPVWKPKIFKTKTASLNLAFRTEYVDWNIGRFTETGGNIADDVVAIVPGISFRPINQTVIRLNYRYEWRRDVLGNPPVTRAVFQFGLSSYF